MCVCARVRVRACTQLYTEVQWTLCCAWTLWRSCFAIADSAGVDFLDLSWYMCVRAPCTFRRWLAGWWEMQMFILQDSAKVLSIVVTPIQSPISRCLGLIFVTSLNFPNHSVFTSRQHLPDAHLPCQTHSRSLADSPEDQCNHHHSFPAFL